VASDSQTTTSGGALEVTGPGGAPNYLYKYRSLAGHAKGQTKQIIVENVLWHSRPEDFNDPFDCSPSLSLKSSKDAFRKYINRLFSNKGKTLSRRQRRATLSDVWRDPARQQSSPELLARVRDAISRAVNSAGILSLSARPDEVLMWSHYAASHTGICLRFRASASPFREAQKVVYSDQRPTLNPVLDDADATLTKSVFVKADFWAYEEEWRVLNSTSGHGLRQYDPWALDGIILGARTSEADVAEVKQWIDSRKQPVDLLRARPNVDRFRIDIVSASEAREAAGELRISGAP
jgi:hypothetical protein